MMNKRRFLGAISLAMTVCFLTLFVLANPFKDKTTENGSVEELGSFSFEEVMEFEDTTDEYDPSLEPGSELAVNNVYFTNYEILYDFLTMDAAGNISYYAAEFLNTRGYGGYHELTILSDTLINEATYPRFICSIDDTDKYIEIRYRTDKQEFEFNMLDKIY